MEKIKTFIPWDKIEPEAQEQIKKVDKKELGAKVVAEAKELSEEVKII
jgi:hypothetical protein